MADKSQPEGVEEIDVVIVGAGPIGLFQVFELGLQGISSVVIDALPHPGGQCAELYPDKPIYDIPAVPVCTGNELIERLQEQIAPFAPAVHLGEEVNGLEAMDDGRYRVSTSGGLQFICRAMVIAAGGGSFTPVRVRLEGLDAFENWQLFYRIRNAEEHAGKHLVILGGGDSALDWALAFSDTAASVTLVNRTDRFRAAEASVNRLREQEKSGKARILLGTATDYRTVDDRLTELQITLRDEARTTEWMAVDQLLVFFGMSPKLGPIEHWGLDFERRLIAVNTETFETSLPGVYAIGDINTYPGKRKLILSGFHEAAMTAYAIKQRFDPDKKVSVQYTTTSPVMQERLGVDADAAGGGSSA